MKIYDTPTPTTFILVEPPSRAGAWNLLSLSLYFSDFLIRSANKDTSPAIWMKPSFQLGLVTMLDNCKISQKNWSEFTAGRAEDLFISRLRSILMFYLHPGLLTVR